MILYGNVDDWLSWENHVDSLSLVEFYEKLARWQARDRRWQQFRQSSCKQEAQSHLSWGPAMQCVLDAEIELSENIPICPSNVLHILQLTSQNCVTLCHLYLPILIIVLLHIPWSIFPQLCTVPNSPMYPQFCLASNSPIYLQFCPVPNSPICHQFCPVPK